MSERDELREKIIKEIGGWELACDEDIEFVADRILALLPQQPKLEWRGDQLFMCELRVGYVAEDRNGQMVLNAGEKIIGGWMPVDTARAAVERVVKEALGWPE